ncbi:unnamed protein product [Colias eurytheme]|nr:unnamed protein product [Colias eurytheme]
MPLDTCLHMNFSFSSLPTYTYGKTIPIPPSLNIGNFHGARQYVRTKLEYIKHSAFLKRYVTARNNANIGVSVGVTTQHDACSGAGTNRTMRQRLRSSKRQSFVCGRAEVESDTALLYDFPG